MRRCAADGSLHSHFHSHFSCHRSRVGKENIIHRGHHPAAGLATLSGTGCAVSLRFVNQLQKLSPQIDGRLMCESTEHHVAHLVELTACCLIKNGMVIAMYGTPPGRHTVDQLSAVGEGNHRAMGFAYFICRKRINSGGIRVPQMLAVEAVVDFLTDSVHIFNFTVWSNLLHGGDCPGRSNLRP